MSRALGLLIAGLCLVATGCRSDGGARGPDPSTASTPVVVTVERIVYVPIDAALTGPEPIAEGPLSLCPQVAAERKAALRRANARFAEIAEIEGTAVEAEPR